MDINSYIHTGRIEHYVLGLASADDAREIERFAAQSPEFQTEIDRVQELLGQLATAYGVQPPADLKAKILAEVDRAASGQPERPKSKTAPKPLEKGEIDASRPTTAPTAQPENWSVAPRQGSSTAALAWALAGLMTLAAGGAAFFAFDFKKKIEAAETQATVATARLAEVEKACNEKEQKQNRYREDIAFIQDAGTKAVVLKGVETKSPSSEVVVHHNLGQKKVFFDVKSLPTPPTGKQYQIWALRGEEKISMGAFDLPKEAGQLVAATFVENPDAFAITLEKQGGSPVPTLEELYVVGALEKPRPPRRRTTEGG